MPGYAGGARRQERQALVRHRAARVLHSEIQERQGNVRHHVRLRRPAPRRTGPGAAGQSRQERALASDIVGKATLLGIEEVALRRKARQTALAKKLGDLLPTYLEIREKGSPDKLRNKLRPNSLNDVVRYLKRAWQPFHTLSPRQSRGRWPTAARTLPSGRMLAQPVLCPA